MTTPQALPPVRTAVCLALAAVAVACGSEGSRAGDPDLTVEILVSPTPASTADTRVVILLTDQGVAPDSAVVTLAAEGPSSSLDAGALRTDTRGRFASGPLSFPEPGAWMLVVSAHMPDGRAATFRRRVTVSGPGGDSL